MPETVTANDATIIHDDVNTALATLAASQNSLATTLQNTQQALAEITHMLTKQFEQHDFVETKQLNANQEFTLDKHGRRWVLIFTPIALASITINIQGVTGSITIPAGWSALNEPDRTILTPPSTFTSQLVVMKYTNFWSGSAA